MQKVKPSSARKKRVNIWLAVLVVITLCVFCFSAGALANRIIMERNLDSQTGEVSEDEEMQKFQDIYETLVNKWYFSKDMQNPQKELLEKAILGMSTLEEDPHTNYFSLEQAEAFTQHLSGSNVGIGVSFYPNAAGSMTVRSVFTNSAADKAGLLPGDVVLKVDDLVTADTSDEDLVAYIQDHNEKAMNLEVERNGAILEIPITPGSYNSTVAMKENGDLGLVEVSVFGENTGKDFSDALKRLKDDGINTLVLDLRDNSGGYLSAAMDMAGSLLGKDKVVFQEKTRDGSVTNYATDGSFAQMDFDNIYVLQNENSASASEVLIGALKDNLGDKVTTVGTTTYGKGTEQTSIPFTDGTSLKYTIAEWLTPSGESVNNKGIEPDVKVESDNVGSVRYTLMEEDEVIEPDTVAPNARPVQIYLQYLDYPADRTDEYFSVTSSEALKQFQQDHGLEATGKVNQETLDALLAEVGLRLNESRDSEDAWLQAVNQLRNQ